MSAIEEPNVVILHAGYEGESGSVVLERPFPLLADDLLVLIRSQRLSNLVNSFRVRAERLKRAAVLADLCNGAEGKSGYLIVSNNSAGYSVRLTGVDHRPEFAFADAVAQDKDRVRRQLAFRRLDPGLEKSLRGRDRVSNGKGQLFRGE